MNYKSFIIAVIAITIFALVWNGIVHLVILSGEDSILNLIGRPESERNLILSLLVTVLLSVLFVWSYVRTAKRGDIREGLAYGLFFGVLAGILVDINQYILYPLPASVVAKWFLFGLIEFCLYGIIVSKIYPIKKTVVS